MTYTADPVRDADAYTDARTRYTERFESFLSFHEADMLDDEEDICEAMQGIDHSARMWRLISRLVQLVEPKQRAEWVATQERHDAFGLAVEIREELMRAQRKEAERRATEDCERAM